MNCNSPCVLSKFSFQDCKCTNITNCMSHIQYLRPINPFDSGLTMGIYAEVSEICNLSFDWWLDCLCPLWLARVINLVLVLWHSIENRSKWINRYRLLSLMDNNQTHNFFLFQEIGLQLIRLLLSLLIISLSIDYTWLRLTFHFNTCISTNLGKSSVPSCLFGAPNNNLKISVNLTITVTEIKLVST